MATLTSQSPYSSSVMSQLVLQASTKLSPMTLIRRFGGAIELQDTALLARLAPGDMIALEAKYHLKCLVKLYNRAADSTGADEDLDGHLRDIAFTELVAYMEDFHMEESVSPVFQLADLAHMYKARLEQLGAVVEGRIHTRLKIGLLLLLLCFLI
ncbi:UNVERIFIED_CONTAM: hypothetical protein FKN15_071279 [Acipenser sinensis]